MKFHLPSVCPLYQGVKVVLQDLSILSATDLPVEECIISKQADVCVVTDVVANIIDVKEEHQRSEYSSLWNTGTNNFL